MNVGSPINLSSKLGNTLDRSHNGLIVDVRRFRDGLMLMSRP
jgi:hypothetical protein